MTTNKMDEIILVVERERLFKNERIAFQGTNSDKTTVNGIMNIIDDNYISMRRGDAEENPLYKQPIPYAIIRRGSEIYMYERLSGGGETKLHGRLSLGAGGHMNPLRHKATFAEVLSVNLGRELEEELDITDKDMKIQTIGLLNDDSDEVGQVHIAVLAIIDVAEDSEVTVRETEQLKGTWVTLEGLKEEATYDRLENWSKIVVDIL